MSLDIETPDPPELSAVDPNEYEDADVAGGEYRRDELEAFLREGAWEEAFARWTADCDLEESDWRIVEDLDLVSRFDFFWDSFADRVGYHAPGIPEDWKEREYHDDLDSWGSVSAINAGLTELGQIACDVLKDEYIDWESEYEAPDDLPDFDA
ncbi:hypothetical protein SAMN04488066_11254 [Halorubrum aquaticum]|uniref:DUF7992 domain-containing protein n=1 Tax=Halorubrum aquaticum TaxID=387340 RepID=A0A1I3BG51_9EURY|nr:hypothetical protein [Halorubrum aquaticum]SFH61267.1 hypothetical protein SAMN04488066_11254 [Halorubrum aquaticum]